MNTHNWIIPDWPAPKNINAICTTREGGVSKGNYASMNLSLLGKDNLEHVEKNRAILKLSLGLKTEPFWLKQVHSNKVLKVEAIKINESKADASISFNKGQACVVLTADCLPVLFCNKKATTVAAAHAGWRGLHKGILENTVKAFKEKPESIIAWLGPAIGPESFEVGPEVREAFIKDYAKTEQAFTQKPNTKWLANIYMIARLRLERAGVRQIYGGGLDTMVDERFFSYRQQAESGRMASLIWF